MNLRLRENLVVITGASSGIGEKIAIECAKQGAYPILLARRVERLEKISREIEKTYKVPCSYYALDVQKIEEIQIVFEKIEREIGTIDILVNNAGFGIFNHAIDATTDEMRAMFEVNVFGLIESTKAVLPKMIERRKGHIINIASQAGKLATPKSSIYAATKHAVLGFTNSLRMELKDENIFVTAVNPGPIRTNFFDIADEGGDYMKNIDRWMLDPNKVAEKIVKAMMTPKREINLPGWMGLGSTIYQIMPGFVELIGGKAFLKK
ncbi:SDR family oxidoreductase [Metabacillus fastidiosus]|uniref:SDR family oxidoreductase n=1 Tax=Metabacillus fastidiosus TaxID=1458 RepID=A0ABU6NUJ5_9BACI|nr:SDR family oxidoreductase [Metabacillus fastidiosus]MED4400823.1 SDR family oxidoreductase [Metabacillus fastidiosus]MED4463751.1 SDR family oxidoreductase [Metabacillus fastidiosus]